MNQINNGVSINTIDGAYSILAKIKGDMTSKSNDLNSINKIQDEKPVNNDINYNLNNITNNDSNNDTIDSQTKLNDILSSVKKSFISGSSLNVYSTIDSNKISESLK